MGGYPNYTVLTKTAGIKSGFVGETSLRREIKFQKMFSLCDDVSLLNIDVAQAVSVN